MALPSGPAIRIRVYLGERDLHGERPLYIVMLERLRLAGAAGASVLNGLAGFGRGSAADADHRLRLSDDLPMVVEAVDAPAQEAALLAVIRELTRESLVTVERVGVAP